jgi:MSHA biogenesis protein MshO
MTVVSRFQRGFTLIEAIVVIVIMGIMIAAIALFLRWPFQSYMDTQRRGQMSDLADGALRRIGRDLHNALPNSVRVSSVAANTCVEFLPTIAGGRYRASVTSTGTGDILDFTTANPADPSFDMFGQFPAAQTPVAGDLVVVYNLGPSSPGADAYLGNTTRPIVSIAPEVTVPNETKITINAGANPYPLASPASRFQVIGTALNAATSYVFTGLPCDGSRNVDAQGNGLGTLSRAAGYPIAQVQACPPAGGALVPLAINVSSCAVQYSIPSSTTNAPQRAGLVDMQLGISQSNEDAILFHEVHVNNAP